MEALKGYWTEDSPCFYMQMVLHSRRMKLLAKLSELKANAVLSRGEAGRVLRSKELLNDILEYKPKSGADDDVMDKVESACNVARRVAGLIHKQAIRSASKKAAGSINKNVIKERKELIEMTRVNDHDGRVLIAALRDRMQQKQEVLLVADDKGTRLVAAPPHAAASVRNVLSRRMFSRWR